jgi:MSHA pilin protein MshC
MRSHTEKMAQPTRVIELGAHSQVSIVTERNGQRGFTLVELITVMVIVGILAVSVLPRFFTVSDFEDRGSADQVKSLLRFAQKTAIAQRRPISVAVSGGAASPNCTTVLAGAALTCQVKSAVAAGAGTYTFNALGQLTAPAAPVTLTIGSTTITVEAETGYVH